MVKIKKEFILNRQGKDMVIYRGLLCAFHEENEQFLAEHPEFINKVEWGIQVTVLQDATEQNGRKARAGAVVVMANGSVWKEEGDAEPGNVNKMILPHIDRMAQTRAKARALSDALNIGDLAVDETDILDHNTEDRTETTTPPRTQADHPPDRNPQEPPPRSFNAREVTPPAGDEAQAVSKINPNLSADDKARINANRNLLKELAQKTGVDPTVVLDQCCADRKIPRDPSTWDGDAITAITNWLTDQLNGLKSAPGARR